ncbi:hypothetical protein SMU58_09861, partial [Streptococcus mutans A19]
AFLAFFLFYFGVEKINPNINARQRLLSYPYIKPKDGLRLIQL